jgi:hypothetical protein
MCRSQPMRSWRIRSMRLFARGWRSTTESWRPRPGISRDASSSSCLNLWSSTDACRDRGIHRRRIADRTRGPCISPRRVIERMAMDWLIRLPLILTAIRPMSSATCRHTATG